MQKGQISVEYLMILGVTFVMIIGASYVFYNYSQSTNTEIVKSQVNVLGNKLVNQAEAIYSVGEGSLVRLPLTVPEEVEEIYVVDSNTLVIAINTPSGTSDSIFFTDFPIDGTANRPGGGRTIGPIYEGKMEITIQSRGSYVLFNSTV